MLAMNLMNNITEEHQAQPEAEPETQVDYLFVHFMFKLD